MANKTNTVDGYSTGLYDKILADSGITLTGVSKTPTRMPYRDGLRFPNAGTSNTRVPYLDGLRTTDSTGTPWYQNSDLLGNVAGLGSSLVQFAALPSQISLANTQKKALEQNIATAKEEQDRRNKNISAFNSVRA